MQNIVFENFDTGYVFFLIYVLIYNHCFYLQTCSSVI